MLENLLTLFKIKLIIFTDIIFRIIETDDEIFVINCNNFYSVIIFVILVRKNNVLPEKFGSRPYVFF